MTRKAYVDLEFKAKLTGYEEINKKIDTLLEKVGSISATTGDTTISGKKTSPDEPESSKKGLSRLTKMLGKLGGATGAILLFTKMVGAVVKQSQVYASIVQLVLHPFVMMVNLMLVPVLKWLVPKVAEWLQWTIDNRAGLELFGKILTQIGDTLNDSNTWLENNPFKVFIESLTRMANIEPNADLWTRFADSIQAAGNMTASIFKPLLDTLGLGWVADVVKNILDAFAEGFRSLAQEGTIGERIKSAVSVLIDTLVSSIRTTALDAIGSIPYVGESLRKFIEETPVSEPGGRLGVDKYMSTTPMMSSFGNTTTNNWGLMLWDSIINPSDVHRFDSTETSLLKSKIGAL